MERRYKIKPERAKDVFNQVVMTPLIFIIIFINLFINYDKINFQNIISITIFFVAYFVAYFVIHQLLKMLMLPRIEQTELIIKKEGVYISSTLFSILPFSNGVVWSEGNFEVVEIKDINNSRFAQMQLNNSKAILSPDDKLLLVVNPNDKNIFRKPAFIFNTALWQIGGHEEIQSLYLLLAELGYPIRTMNPEETEGTYFYHFEDYGKRSNILVTILIGLLIANVVLFMMDGYLTLEYGYTAPFLWGVGIMSWLLALLWIKTVRKHIWLHIALSAMFAIFFTVFVFTVLINSTPFFGTEQNVNFHYNSQKNTWLMENHPTVVMNCRSDKDKVNSTSKSFTILKSLRMIRIKEDWYCKGINNDKNYAK